MRSLLSIKTLGRSPVRTLLTFILLGVVTFAFFSQVAEYAVTMREFNNATKQYCGLGAVEVTPPETFYLEDGYYLLRDPRMAMYSLNEYWSALRYHPSRYYPLTQKQVSEISAFPYISLADTRYMTAGVSPDLFRLDEYNLYNHTLRCVVEGTLKIESGLSSYFFLSDCRLLAGNPTYPVEHETLKVYPGASNKEGAGWITTSRVLVTYPPFYKFNMAYMQTLTPGSRYACVLRFEPSMQAKPKYAYDYYLSGDLTIDWCDAVWPAEGTSEEYLQRESYAPLRELVEITNADAHTFDMVYTEDMRSILRFADGTMTITDGRALNREDTANGSAVCVISREVAEEYNLKVGDKIALKLGTELFEQYKGIGAAAVTRERYKRAEIPAELEIVGIYADLDGLFQRGKPNWCYSINTVFVPKSLLPVDENLLTDHEFSPAEFSFKVENAWDIEPFLEEVAPKFGEMGLRLLFDDDGWPGIAGAFRAARQASIIKIAVISAAVIAATGFVVYLFISRKKKEYAVMRALGTTKKDSSRALVLPLMTVAVIAILAGSAAAWVYTVKTITQNNTLSLLKEYSVSTTIPAWAVICCVAGEILVTLLIGFLLLRRIGKLSPLSLLLDNGSSRTRDKTKAGSEKTAKSEARTSVMNTAVSGVFEAAAQKASAPISSPAGASAAPVQSSAISCDTGHVQGRRKEGSIRFVLRYIWKHMRRSAGKTLLAVLLAVLLFVAVGQLALMKESYVRLTEETVITAKFVGGLQLGLVPGIKNSVYVGDSYYAVMKGVDINSASANLIFTNDIARFTSEEPIITYADGYDASVMDQFDHIIIAGKALMETNGLKLGDTVKVNQQGLLISLQSRYILEYRQAHPGDTITDEEILAPYRGEIETALSSATRTYIVAGAVTTTSGVYDGMAFTPGDGEATAAVGEPVKLETAEFTLADNKLVDKFRDFGEKMAGGRSSGVTFIMDTSKLDHIKSTQRLLETMYPIAVAAALIIGGFLCCLVIVQSSKEAAIMRIQGTTKRKTRTLLALEQVLLNIAGLVIGAAGLVAYKGAVLGDISAQIGLFAALYFIVILSGASTCSALATRRNVLELLQTKE